MKRTPVLSHTLASSRAAHNPTLLGSGAHNEPPDVGGCS